eukprot:TRINITY_DN463_c0_g4_i1.p1 TRINITY_DN463_c0_g4~~TRINITY_DN463_c0_g4_i1.p1  ORF type:complete len:247 (+),score=46.17 TRINITY_DN463_c0_g4_i1:252-992(+)
MHRWLSLMFLAVCFNATAMPDSLLPLVGHRTELLTVRASGLLHYQCHFDAPTSTGVWQSVGVNASLAEFGTNTIVGIHYFLPTPDAADSNRAWSLTGQPPSSAVAVSIADVPVEHSIALLLYRVTSHDGFPASRTGPGMLANATYINRLVTTGGVPPPSAMCTAPANATIVDVGYAATYVFYGRDPQSASSTTQDKPSGGASDDGESNPHRMTTWFFITCAVVAIVGTCVYTRREQFEYQRRYGDL